MSRFALQDPAADYADHSQVAARLSGSSCQTNAAFQDDMVIPFGQSLLTVPVSHALADTDRLADIGHDKVSA